MYVYTSCRCTTKINNNKNLVLNSLGLEKILDFFQSFYGEEYALIFHYFQNKHKILVQMQPCSELPKRSVGHATNKQKNWKTLIHSKFVERKYQFTTKCLRTRQCRTVYVCECVFAFEIYT